MSKYSFPFQQVYHIFLLTKNVPIHFIGKALLYLLRSHYLASFLFSTSVELLGKFHFYSPFLVIIITKKGIVGLKFLTHSPFL